LPFGFLQAQTGFVAVEPIGFIDTASTDTYLNSLFVIFITVAVILSVIRLMICGIKYMTSESVSSKGAAKTCLQYVLGGLFLAITSYIILETVNEDLVNASFTSITDGIEEGIGDVNDLAGVGLDGSSPRSSQETEKWFRYQITNACGGGVIDRFSETLSSCNDDMSNDIRNALWAVKRDCFETASGNYQYVLRNVGFGCPAGDFTSPEYAPVAGAMTFIGKNDACEAARDFKLATERNFTLVSGCVDTNPGP
jgi:hypothetical protein